MYYNRYDSKKNYKELRFFDSRFIQSAEQNEMQSYIREDIKNISGSIFEQGGILKGGGVSVTETRANIEEATLFHNGYSVYAAAATFEVPGLGRDIIGSAIKEEIVTDKEINKQTKKFLIICTV